MISKHDIRQKIWRVMEERNIALFPRPVFGRIPNFIGAEVAAKKLLEIAEFISAETVKVNPDSPQRPVRELVLRMGKTLIMPTPRLKKGFLLLDPIHIRNFKAASTIKGAFKSGRYIHPKDLPHIDFIVEGSVAVSLECDRIGKGEGYGELEYVILLEYGKINPEVKIATTIHDIQIVESIPRDPYDVPIDYILTPSRIIYCRKRKRRPDGILWRYLKKEKIDEIPILKELLAEKGFR